MNHTKLYAILTYLIAAVWFINGLLCKVLNLVPRHQQIVSTIIGDQYSRTFTIIIGLLEVGMAVWVLSKIKPKINAVFQIVIVASMNILEFFIASELLLWG
ncbi:hypothetical protein E1176_00795, partial [Fulvivirga sp. RKSG066]|uniref:DoxX-like family protein n=1 Tax=Fulvivirga aurantia TaxID=2529383 RepID=UPI0012BB56B8